MLYSVQQVTDQQINTRKGRERARAKRKHNNNNKLSTTTKQPAIEISNRELTKKTECDCYIQCNRMSDEQTHTYRRIRSCIVLIQSHNLNTNIILYTPTSKNWLASVLIRQWLAVYSLYKHTHTQRHKHKCLPLQLNIVNSLHKPIETVKKKEAKSNKQHNNKNASRHTRINARTHTCKRTPLYVKYVIIVRAVRSTKSKSQCFVDVGVGVCAHETPTLLGIVFRMCMCMYFYI